MVRTDSTVDFDWAGSAPAPGLPATDFLVRWEGTVAVPTTGQYRFGASSGDGVRIWVDNQLVVDRWAEQLSWVSPHWSAPISMTTAVPKVSSPAENGH